MNVFMSTSPNTLPLDFFLEYSPKMFGLSRWHVCHKLNEQSEWLRSCPRRTSHFVQVPRFAHETERRGTLRFWSLLLHRSLWFHGNYSANSCSCGVNKSSVRFFGSVSIRSCQDSCRLQTIAGYNLTGLHYIVAVTLLRFSSPIFSPTYLRCGFTQKAGLQQVRGNLSVVVTFPGDQGAV